MSKDTITLPRAQFIEHIQALAMESEWYWHTSDEVKEKVSATDILRVNNCDHIDVNEQRVELGYRTTTTESEKVARRTHWQPAEYKNHDVDVFARVIMEWPDDQYDIESTAPIVEVEQEGGAPDPRGQFIER